MKIKHKILSCIVLSIIVTFTFSTTALATVTESEVQAQVSSRGSGAVTGNIFIWFLCAVAFLKISQKVDSFMSSLGINVGNTGGSMIAELMVASKGLAMGRNIFSGGIGGAGARGAAGASGNTGAGGAVVASGANGSPGLMSGGLAGVVGRSVNRGAAQRATAGEGGGIGGAIYASSVEKGGYYANNAISSVAKGNINTNGSISGDNAVQAFNSYMGYTELNESSNISQNVSAGTPGGMPDVAPSTGYTEFTESTHISQNISAGAPGGMPDAAPSAGYTEFTESTHISQNISAGGMPDAVPSVGYTESTHISQNVSAGTTPDAIPSYTNIEIGGGRIMGTETSPDNPDGIQFGMYSTEQYMQPTGNYDTVSTVDGSQWYKQYAQDAVDKTPYTAPDGTVAYNESIVKKLPDTPRRKDRV